MHRDAFMGAIDGCEERDDVKLPALADGVERPGTVFTAAPCEPRLGRHLRRVEAVLHRVRLNDTGDICHASRGISQGQRTSLIRFRPDRQIVSSDRSWIANQAARLFFRAGICPGMCDSWYRRSQAP